MCLKIGTQQGLYFRELAICMLFSSFYELIDSQVITGPPGLVNNSNVATNFNLTFTATVPTSKVISCDWVVTGTRISFYNTACGNPSTLSLKNMTCTKSVDIVSTTYYNIYSVETNVVVQVDCSTVKTPNFALTVKYCPHGTGTNKPNVTQSSFTYNTPGHFVCPAGQELFYSNSTPGITNTICQKDATWYGSSGLECWGDPRPNMTGIFSGIEGTTTTAYCNPLNMVYPPVVGYNFVIGDTQTKNNKSFIVNLTREMNGKTLQCQAITKYTQIRLDKGWSQPHTLNITYSPYLFGNYKCIGNQPCNITLSSNPSPHEANLMTGNESKPVTWIKQSNSTHVVQINEPAGNYKLLVSNSVGQTSLSVVISATRTNPPPGNNSALIIGISVAGVVVTGVIIFAAVGWIRKRKAKSGKDSVEFKKSEAVYVNTQVYENTEAQQNTPEYQNIHGTDNTGNVEKAHLYEVPITLHSKPDNN